MHNVYIAIKKHLNLKQKFSLDNVTVKLCHKEVSHNLVNVPLIVYLKQMNKNLSQKNDSQHVAPLCLGRDLCNFYIFHMHCDIDCTLIID